MDKPNTMFDVIRALRYLADCIEVVAGTITEHEVASFEQIYPPVEEQSEESKPEASEKAVTLTEVRAVLAGKSREGFTEEVKQLLMKHGAEKLSGIAESEYAALLKEAENLGS